MELTCFGDEGLLELLVATSTGKVNSKGECKGGVGVCADAVGVGHLGQVGLPLCDDLVREDIDMSSPALSLLLQGLICTMLSEVM